MGEKNMETKNYCSTNTLLQGRYVVGNAMGSNELGITYDGCDNVTNKKCFVKKEVVVWECRNCGHKHIGKEAPVVCPVCDHPQAHFEVEAINY